MRILQGLHNSRSRTSGVKRTIAEPLGPPASPPAMIELGIVLCPGPATGCAAPATGRSSGGKDLSRHEWGRDGRTGTVSLGPTTDSKDNEADLALGRDGYAIHPLPILAAVAGSQASRRCVDGGDPCFARRTNGARTPPEHLGPRGKTLLVGRQPDPLIPVARPVFRRHGSQTFGRGTGSGREGWRRHWTFPQRFCNNVARRLALSYASDRTMPSSLH